MSDLKKMIKSWRESWSKDSKVASQAVILMFIPTILELWLNKSDACLEKKRKLSELTLKQMRVMGKARQASLHLHLHFSLTHLLFRLYSWAPGMNTSRRVKLSSQEYIDPKVVFLQCLFTCPRSNQAAQFGSIHCHR